MKKIAILIPGLARTYKDTFENFKENLLSNNSFEFDIFIDTWNKVGRRKDSHVYMGEEKRYDEEEELDVEELKRIYNPKKINVEEWDTFKEDLKIHAHSFRQYSEIPYKNIEALFSQYYKMKNCFNLIEDPLSYDLVIRTRFDIVLNERLNINRSLLETSSVSVMSPIFYCPNPSEIFKFYENKIDPIRFTDTFFMSSPENMSICCDLFFRFFDYRFVFEKIFNRGGYCAPEYLMEKHLEEKMIPITPLKLNFGYIR